MSNGHRCLATGFILALAVAAGLLFFVCKAYGQRPPAGYFKYGRECAKTQQKVMGQYWSSMLLAQVEVESAWKPTAQSPYASGLTQFTPGTQRAVERQLGIAGNIFNPHHACLLQAHLMKQLAADLSKLVDGWLGHWVMPLRGYNGSPANLVREWEVCGRPKLWLDIEPCRGRRTVAQHRENVSYPHKTIARWSKYFWLWEGAWQT